MKFHAIFCLTFLSIQATYSLPKPINNILREKIESIRQQMPCGINGGPGLVPFRKDFVDVSYDNSTTFRVTGVLKDIQVDNLDKFTVDNIDFSLLRLNLDFGFTLPNATMKGFYNVTGQYNVNRLKLWGNGPFLFQLNDVQLSGSLRLRIMNGHLDMTVLKIVLALTSLNSDITGILGSDETSFLINTIIEDMVPQMLDTYSIDIGNMLSEYLTPIANEYLHQLTLSDLFGGGSGGGDACTTNMKKNFS